MTILVAPLEALTDPLLSDPERRVLLALFSFRAKNTENVYPKLPALAERSLVKDHTRISKLTTSLANKGWLTKKKRGFTGCNQYFLTIPERLSNLDSETNLAPETNLDADTNSNLDSETKSNVAPETKYREQTIEQTIEQTTTQKFSAADYKMAETIFKGVLSVSPKAKTPDFNKWADDIRLMRERDGHSSEEIFKVFVWANSDPFWKTNILSTSKLREKFAALHTKMINGGSNAISQPNTQSRGTPAQRAKALRESKQQSDGSVVGCDAGNLRPQVGEQVRIGADNGVD